MVAVFLVYQPAWQGEYLWDDNLHLLENPVLKPGGLATVWTPGGYKQYWPLTFTAYWLQFKLWGLNPLGFHLVNIALHAVSALFVWRVLAALRLPGARFAAAIFALHPVNVESVAWIAQLKGILSLLLSLVSMLSFLAYERRGGWWRSALAIGAVLSIGAGQGHRDHAAAGAAGVCLVAARPNWTTGPPANPPFLADRDHHVRDEYLDAAP